MAQGISISYSVKYLPCNDAECTTCLMGKGHGPYWYAQYELAGEQKNVFLGKEFRPLDLEKVIRKNMEQVAKQNSVEAEEPLFASEDYANSFSDGFASEQVQSEKEAIELGGNHIDRIDASKIKRVKKNTATFGVIPMPSRAEFEQDLQIMRGAAMNRNLKFVYRKMIKKYHPDKFQGNPIMDHWMSEINTQYHRLSSQAS